jgi:hypothetical protein
MQSVGAEAGGHPVYALLIIVTAQGRGSSADAEPRTQDGSDEETRRSRFLLSGLPPRQLLRRAVYSRHRPPGTVFRATGLDGPVALMATFRGLDESGPHSDAA